MKILVFLFVVLIILGGYEAIRIYKLKGVSKELVTKSTAFEREAGGNGESYLFLGDSLAVGVGAENPQESIAGRFGKENGDVNIKNLAKSGARIKDALGQIESLGVEDRFKTIFIQVGANDIVHLTREAEARKDLLVLLKTAKVHSDQVIFYTSGSVGYAPLFPLPLDLFYTWRSKKFLKIYKEVAEEASVTYVDLYYERQEDPFTKDVSKYYALDKFHLSGEGYAVWYERIKKAL